MSPNALPFTQGEETREPLLKNGMCNESKPPGGGGGGGGGDPGGGDDGNDDEDNYSERGSQSRSDRGPKAHHPLTRESKNPFDCRDKTDVEKYNGEDNRLWRKKTTNFLAAKHAPIVELLKWAGTQKTVLTSDRANTQWPEADAVSFHLWGFLNTKLTDDAWDLFDGAKMRDGLEVWRLINLNITQLTQAEVMSLEDVILMPRRLKLLSEIPKGLVAWDAAHRAFKDNGGKPLDEAREVGAFMRLFPDEVRQTAVWEWDKCIKNPIELRRWIHERNLPRKEGASAR
jgi:hypothetical protein